MAADEKPFLRVVQEGEVPPTPEPPVAPPASVVTEPLPTTKVVESEHTRVLRAKVIASDDALQSASKFAAIGTAIIGGAVELGRGKSAEAVQAWVSSHVKDVDRAHFDGALTYEKMPDLKEAVMAAAEELDAANAPSLSSALYIVVGHMEEIAAPLPSHSVTFWDKLRDLYWLGADVLAG